MAASDPHPQSDRPPPGAVDCLTPAALRERLEEEISRAERHGTGLSCLLVVIDNLEEMALEHGSELCEQTLEYVAGALRHELRRYDRVGRDGRAGPDPDDDLLIILPGADSPRGEIVARRALERLRTIKVEARGTRQPLHVSVGLAAWREDPSAEALLARARAAVPSANGDQTPSAGLTPPRGEPTESADPRESAATPASSATRSALGRAERS
jgi:diguanylate cyclase (GGDEF)-like protein